MKKKKTIKKIARVKQPHKRAFENIALLIDKARTKAYSKVNTELMLLYYNVGKIVSEKVEKGVWGESTVDELAAYIETKNPELKGFNRRGLYRMKQFFETYNPETDCFRLWLDMQSQNVLPAAAQSPALKKIKKSKTPAQLQKQKTNVEFVSAVRTQIDTASLHQQFVTTVLTQITWTNHRFILSKTQSPEEKFYYLLICVKEKYSTRELERALNSAQFERTMLSKPIVSAVRTQLPEGFFKDPYIFEFLDLPEVYSENDLEKALIKNLQKFILEIGKGFTYMGAQFRMQAGNKDYYTDLLFFQRDLQCLVLFELKIQDFEPEFLGKLNFYLEALDRNVKLPHENPSIGVLLCKGKEVVEYAMQRNMSPALIAEYKTRLINKKLLANKLHQLSELFRQNIQLKNL